MGPLTFDGWLPGFADYANDSPSTPRWVEQCPDCKGDGYLALFFSKDVCTRCNGAGVLSE